MSSALLDRLRSTLSQCAEIEEKLTALSKRKDGKSSSSSSSSADLEAKASKLRTKLCEHYCEVLLCDPDFALRRDVPSRLWKACFYNRINELRSRATKERGRMKKSIKRSDKDAAGRHRQAVEDVERSLKKFLGEAMALYNYLISQYEQKLLNAVDGDDDDEEDDGGKGKMSSMSSGSTPVILSNSKSGRGLFDPNNDDVFAIARKEQQSKNKTKNKKNKGQSDSSSDEDDNYNDNDNDDENKVPAALVPILYKLILFLGDLQRYAMEHEEATECYTKASRLAPGRGNPYNQLAVVAQVSEQNLQAHPLTAVALYWYCRSLLADEAFETSESNMERLFVMNQKWVAENIAAGTDGGIVDTISGGGGAGNDDASEMTEAASTSHMSRGSRWSNYRNRKAQLEANRAAKSAMSRKFLAQFVDVHYDVRNLTKAIEEAAAAAAQAADDVPISLTPMVSNSRKDQGQQEGGAKKMDLGSFDPSTLLQRISTLEASMSSLLTIAAFSDALLCKLVCINAYSYFKASSATAGASSEDEANVAELISATLLLSFGATIGRQLDWNLSKIKKKKKKDGTDSRQQQQQLSVRLLSPFVVLCDLISQFYVRSGSGSGQAARAELMALPVGIRQGKYSSSKGCDEGIAAAFSKAQYDFWTQVAAVANTVRSMEAFTTLVNTTSASGMDDDALRAFPLPKEYGDFRGFAPFVGVFASYESSDAGLGSGKDAYLSAERAVTVLDLSQSQSQTQSQGSASGQKSKESNKSSAEAHARVLHFLLFLKRHCIDPEPGAPKMEEGQYLFEERGKLTSILDNSTLNDIDENDGDDNVVGLGSDIDDNDNMGDAAAEASTADVEASETTCASPSLAGGVGQSEGSANLLQYKKGTDSGPALLVPTMFGAGAGDGNAGGAAASAATDALRKPQPSALDAASTLNPASSVTSQPSLMSGISYQQPQPQPQLQPQARQGMDGVVLEGMNQQQYKSSGHVPPGFASGAGLPGNAPPPPGMMQPNLFAQAPAGSGGGLPSTGLSFQGGPPSLNTANPFVPAPSSNQNMNTISSDNLLFPPPQSSLLGGASGGFGVNNILSGAGAGAGNNGGGLVSSLLGPAGGIFGSVEDILNVSSEHDDEKNATGGNYWSQQTNNPFAANIK